MIFSRRTSISQHVGFRTGLAQGSRKEAEQLNWGLSYDKQAILMVLLIGRRRPQVFLVSILLTFNLLLEEPNTIMNFFEARALVVSRGLRSPTCK